MSDAYVTAKIHEALKATNGDEKDAVKLMTTWAVRDQALLLGLTKSELKDLIGARIHEVLKHSKKSHHEDNDAADNEAITFGHPKGDKRHASKVPPPKSSARQASVMHQLAAAFKKK